jgi:hypothetical protein
MHAKRRKEAGIMVNSVSNQAHIDPHALKQYIESARTTARAAGEKNFVKSLLNTTDTVTLGSSSEASATYTQSLTINETKGDGFDMLRGLVLNMLKEQGIDFKIANGDSEIDLSKITQEDAQKLIAEDGYFGVDQTSDRIVDFAIAAAGSDPSRLDAIKAGVEKGFKEALKAFGGSLPDISYDTYDAIMNKLDAWAQTGNDGQVTQITG